MFFVILGIVLWVILALAPAYMAKKKGYSFIPFFLFGVLLSWLLSLLVVLFLQNKNLSPEEIAAEKAATAAIERETQ